MRAAARHGRRAIGPAEMRGPRRPPRADDRAVVEFHRLQAYLPGTAGVGCRSPLRGALEAWWTLPPLACIVADSRLRGAQPSSMSQRKRIGRRARNLYPHVRVRSRRGQAVSLPNFTI
eukprot:scaffold1938_cov399-Prasinococcus_capsulatus_cf.AAC.28